MKQYLYLSIHIGCFLFPFLASFYPKHAFYKEWKPFLLANLLIAIGFILWDIVFTAQGIWGFSSEYVMGIYLYKLPIEEILFFFTIPYCCVFTYFALRYLLPRDPLASYNNILLGFFGIISFVFVFWGMGKAYTFVTGILNLMLLTHLYCTKTNISHVFLSYFCILPFFLISNGILTGYGLEQPIVWYNNHHNLVIRIVTIPVEDAMYGFLLIVLNIRLYETLRQRFSSPFLPNTTAATPMNQA